MAESTEKQIGIGSFDQQQEIQLAKLRESVPSETRMTIEKLGKRLEATLLCYAIRPDSDQEVFQLLENLILQLDNSLQYGPTAYGLPKQSLLNVKAGLVGACRVLDHAGEQYSPIESLEHVALAALFLELAERRVGTVDKKTGVAEIRMSLGHQTAGHTVKFSKSKV